MNRRLATLLSILIFLMMCAAAVLIWLLYSDVPVQQLRHRVQQSEEVTSEALFPAARDTVAQTVAVVEEQVVIEGLDKLDGPFEVTNGQTHKTNLLSRKGNELILTDENSAQLWAIPFESQLCGMAATVDYYSNKKLQFLFASGSSVYLYDRLGRPVKGFSLNLPKEVLLGPAVYDFNHNGKLYVGVLHKDNSFAVYDMKGVQPAKWQGITAPSTIIAMPQYVENGKTSYWVVKVKGKTLVYSFYGGEPVKTCEGSVNPQEAVAAI